MTGCGTDRPIDRQTDRPTDRQTDRPTDGVVFSLLFGVCCLLCCCSVVVVVLFVVCCGVVFVVCCLLWCFQLCVVCWWPEAADLIYHLLVMLQNHEISLADVVSELKARHD